MKKITLSLLTLIFFALSFFVSAQSPEPSCNLKAKFHFKADSCRISFFDASAAGAGTTITGWFWDFGDANTSTIQNPLHVYAASGNYTVCLTITGINAAGAQCKDRICLPVKVVSCSLCHPCKLSAKFYSKPDNCKISFLDASIAGAGTTITGWFWDFGDANTSTLQNPTHVYSVSGIYTVCLTITGVNSTGEKCEQKVCQPVTVKGCDQTRPCRLVPKFYFKTDSCKISFFDASAAGAGTTITSWFWDFGDGNTSTLQNPTHIYASSGIYKVCLTITGVNAAGERCKNQFCVTIRAKACDQTPPCRLFPKFYLKTDSCKISFFDASAAGAGTTITSWFWDFGDGNTSPLQSPTHVYAVSGIYKVCLTITGVNTAGERCKNQFCVTIKVKACDQVQPCRLSPKFYFKADSCKISFFDASVTGAGTTITSWVWDFGDGNISMLQNPTHVYAISGMYTVCLTITAINSTGEKCGEKICMQVPVKGCDQTYPCQLAPKFNFRVDSCQVIFFDFSVIGVGTTVTSWFWDFGDGNTSTLQNPTHVYPASGMYTVCLTVTGVNAAGIQCKADICIMVTLNDCDKPGVSSKRVNNSVLQLQAYPNPAQNIINISFNMVHEGQVHVAVEDMQGRVLSVLQEGHLAVGYHNLAWKAGVSPGWYLIILKTDSGIERKQILVE